MAIVLSSSSLAKDPRMADCKLITKRNALNISK